MLQKLSYFHEISLHWFLFSPCDIIQLVGNPSIKKKKKNEGYVKFHIIQSIQSSTKLVFVIGDYIAVKVRNTISCL